MSSPSSFDEAIIAVYAALRPDGSIEVELLIPEQDEPFVANISAIRETRRLARPGISRPIQLDADWDDENAALRRIVNAFVRRAEQRRLDRLRGAQAAVPA